MSMHIAFFVSSLNVGGVERAFVNLANCFVDEGHKVDFIVCQNVGELKSELSDKINVIAFKDSRLRKCFRPLYKYIKKSSADCLISGPTYPNIIAVICNFFAFNKMKIIANQHSYQDVEMDKLGIVGKIAPFLIKRTYNHATKVVAVSEGIKNDLITNYSIKPDKVITIYNAVLTSHFFEKAKQPIDDSLSGLLSKKYIIAVGRLETVKNYPFMLKAFSNIKESVPSFDHNLIILGEGAEKEKIQNEIKKLKLEDSVYLLGAFANPLPILKRADLLIHSSLIESMGLVYVEALALKVPVVTVTNSGAEEILKDVETKEIVDLFDEDKFIAAILKMMGEKFEDNDFPALREFESKRIMESYLNII
ncbi:glycosyltransferase [Flavobacterium suzhouense]|uniref:Glycosyltransferase n=1 Tax=Flavobacterium suzhouense TaxID=1529638 RepID=A0ABW5NQA7_9FLAO